MLKGAEIGLYDGKEYTRHTVEDPSEVLSLQGNVSMKEGKPFVHLHVSLAGHDFTAKGGHLFGAEVYMTVELVMRVFEPGLIRKPVGGVFWQMDGE
jgi:predicted DNA-binding protein with PD1-like motif